MCLECLRKSIAVANNTGPNHCKACADLLFHEVKLNSLKERLRLMQEAALVKIEFDVFEGSLAWRE